MDQKAEKDLTFEEWRLRILSILFVLDLTLWFMFVGAGIKFVWTFDLFASSPDLRLMLTGVLGAVLTRKVGRLIAGAEAERIRPG